MANKNVTIISESCIPAHIQSEIRTRFSTAENKEVEVLYNQENKEYEVYQNGKYITCFDEERKEFY